MDSNDKFPNKSGFLVIDWITGEDEWEEVGAIDYWQASAIVEALKKHKAELYGQLTYYKAKVEKGKKAEDDGIYVLEKRYKSAEEMSELMFNIVRKMRGITKIMKPIKAIQDLGRTPEHGRIRLGVKTERAMKSLDTFRFTSPDKEAIQQIADAYGGDVKSWTPPKSKQEQWEVITTSSEIRVFLPPNSIDVWYEQWSGGGCQRRCDGVSADVPVKTQMAWTLTAFLVCVLLSSQWFVLLILGCVLSYLKLDSVGYGD